VVPWEDVEYLVLHEASHEAETGAGCSLLLDEDESERLTDAIAVRRGADPSLTHYGPTKDDYARADWVLGGGTCG